jgi:hypothetical protein
MPGKVRAHYAGSYTRQARKVRAQAYADESTTCWRCGRTRAEHGKPWTAGHLNDGQVGGPLAPECQTCNTSAGAKLGNARRQGLRTTRDW